ncbi:MAG TPA: RCC1 domain-containing protein [Kofleriaceae bacterium]|nr:RCC1 domain-containing protein [Kofleriaceae bacterium]
MGIDSGTDHTCVVLDTGKVRCWGDSLYGQVGYGTTDTIGDNETPASAGDVTVF